MLVSGALWDQALSGMVNLTTLRTTDYVVFTKKPVAAISFRLRTLACYCVDAALADLISGQDDLEELSTDLGVVEVPKPGSAPRLSALRGPASAIAAVTPGRPLSHLWFNNDCGVLLDRSEAAAILQGTGQLTRLRLKARQLSMLSRTGSILAMVEEVIVDQDITWESYIPKVRVIVNASSRVLTPFS